MTLIVLLRMEEFASRAAGGSISAFLCRRETTDRHYQRRRLTTTFIKQLITTNNLIHNHVTSGRSNPQLHAQVSKFIHNRPSGSNDTTEIDKQSTCMHLTQVSSVFLITQSCVAHRPTVPPGQPDIMPTRGPVSQHVRSTQHEQAFCPHSDALTTGRTNDTRQPVCR